MAAAEQKAAKRIWRWYKQTKQTKPHNATCAITLRPIAELDSVFVKVTEARYVRAYDKASLLAYFKHAPQTPIKWPVSREHVSSIELRRLERGLRPRDQLSTKLGRIWAHVFLVTLTNSLEVLYAEVQRDIDVIENKVGMSAEDVIMGGEEDRLSSFLASMLYLYVTSKTKYRSLKNRMKRRTRGVNMIVFDSICNVVDEMSSCFHHHELLLSWKGATIVPILLNFENSVDRRLLR